MKHYLKASLIVAMSFVLMGQTRFPPQGTALSTIIATDNTWTGTQTFGDEAFLVCDDGDGTKCLEFEASGVSASTTRTFTVPDISGTLALLGGTQTFTGAKTFSTNATFSANVTVAPNGGLWDTNFNGFRFGATIPTPDTMQMYVGTASNAFHILQVGDASFDFNNCSAGTSAQSNPTLCIHSSDQATNEWAEVNVDTAGGASLKSAQELYFQSGQVGTAGGTALSGGSATAVVEIGVAQGAHNGGVLHWTVVADDGSDYQSLSGSTTWQAVNPAGTEVCTVETTGGATEAVSAGTLTTTVTCTTGLTDVVQLALNATSSLTETTLVAYWTLILNGPGTVTPQ